MSHVEGISQELASLNYYKSDDVNTRLQSIKDTFSNLKNLSDDRKERIQNGIAVQQKLDSMRLDFAKKAAVSSNSFDWLGGGRRGGFRLYFFFNRSL